jgi:membrane associated rhomboid family serine protease
MESAIVTICHGGAFLFSIFKRRISMKRIFAVIFTVLALAAFFVMPAFAQGEVPATEVTDPVQLYVIGLIASGIVYGLNLLMKRYPQVKIKRDWLTVALYALSLLLAIYWGGVIIPAFPAFSDPVTFVAALFGFISSLLVALAVPTSFATLIYNVFLKRVFDALAVKAGWIALPEAK